MYTVQEKTTSQKEPPSPKRNNYVQNESGGMQSVKYLIVLEMLLGVNRVYLFCCRKFTRWMSYVYTIILLLTLDTYLITDVHIFATELVFRVTVAVEHLVLGLNALVLQENNLLKFFSTIKNFDKNLNILNEKLLVAQKRHYLYAIGAAVLYNIFEDLLNLCIWLNNDVNISLSNYLLYIPVMVHEIETVFFCFLLTMVLKRLIILKAHVLKSLVGYNAGTNDAIVETSGLEKLASNIYLDTSSLYNAYDLLHKCCNYLNFIINLSLIVMLVASGLSTIMIMKFSIKEFQDGTHSDIIVKSIFAFALIRCIKYIILLSMPCYYSNKTKAQVEQIRVIIYDTLNSNAQLDKIENRKLKAFFQLTHQNTFTYSLGGVLKLDMTLPLSYISVCVTYLIIIVQFSKFID